MPLIHTKWQQGDYHQTGHPRQQTSYNKFCPTGCYAGCGAVAMAQILNYWKWDVNQTGSNTFDGQTVNFGNYTSYCWENMPLDYANDFNSKLIYHAGVSCNTDYCKSGSASLSLLENVLYGFKNYWGMSPNAEIKRRLWIMIPTWSNRLKEELNSGRPIFYAGGEHSWVIDGYSEIGFHCNWGSFDGIYDNYYYLGDFNLPGVDYNSEEYAIFNLQPATSVINNLLGPDIVTSTPVTYYIQNIADCKYATWVITPNLQNVYGSNHWTVVKAIGNGVGWIDGTYVLDGVIHNAPRKYVTCVP